MESRVFPNQGAAALWIFFGSCSRKHRLGTWTPGVPADGDGADHKVRGPCLPLWRSSRCWTIYKQKLFLLHLPHISNAPIAHKNHVCMYNTSRDSVSNAPNIVMGGEYLNEAKTSHHLSHGEFGTDERRNNYLLWKWPGFGEGSGKFVFYLMYCTLPTCIILYFSFTQP